MGPSPSAPFVSASRRALNTPLILFFFVGVYLASEIANQTGMYYLRLLAFVFPSIYILQRVLAKKKSRKRADRRFQVVYLLLIGYALLHIRAVGLVNSSLIYQAGIGLGLLVHITYWFQLSLQINSLPDFSRVIRAYFGGLLLVFIFVIFIPMNVLGEFRIGGHYNLGDIDSPMYVPFTSSTIEPPMISGIIALAGIGYFLRKGWKPDRDGNHKIVTAAVVPLMLFLALLELLLISRRGPAGAVILTLTVIFLGRLFIRTPLVYLLSAFVLLPIGWTVISPYIIQFFTSSIGEALFARTDYESLATATGRIVNWGIALQHLVGFEFSADYLMGIGELDQYVLMGPYGHAHNSMLQLLIEVGIIGAFFHTLLVLITLGNLRALHKARSLSYGAIMLAAPFLMILFISGTESLYITNYFSHLLFLSLVILIHRYRQIATAGPG